MKLFTKKRGLFLDFASAELNMWNKVKANQCQNLIFNNLYDIALKPLRERIDNECLEVSYYYDHNKNLIFRLTTKTKNRCNV
jgi:hypothetical protein